MAPTSSLTLLPPTPRPSTPSPTPTYSSSSSSSSSDASQGSTDASSKSGDKSFDQQLKKARGRKAKPADAKVDTTVTTAKKPTAKGTDPSAAKVAADAASASAQAGDTPPTTDAPPTNPHDPQPQDGATAANDATQANAADAQKAQDAVSQLPPTDATPTVPVKVKDKAHPVAKAVDANPDPTAAATPQPTVAPIKPTDPQPTASASQQAVAKAGDAANHDGQSTDGSAATTTAAAGSDASSAATASSTPQPTKPVPGLGSAKVKAPGARNATNTGDTATATNAAVTTALPPTDSGTTADGGDSDDSHAAAPVPLAAGTPTPVANAVGLIPGQAALTKSTTPVATGSGNPSSGASADDATFAQDNHSNISAAVHGQLMPNGGTLQIRLDPANLGTVQVTVRVRDGSVSASFETNNDDATRMLSHSLGQLKSSLEATGITVDHMHVAQSSKSSGGDTTGTGKDGNGTGADGRAGASEDQQSRARQDQQRRDLLQKMWQRLSGGSDPIDLVA